MNNTKKYLVSLPKWINVFDWVTYSDGEGGNLYDIFTPVNFNKGGAPFGEDQKGDWNFPVCKFQSADDLIDKMLEKNLRNYGQRFKTLKKEIALIRDHGGVEKICSSPCIVQLFYWRYPDIIRAIPRLALLGYQSILVHAPIMTASVFYETRWYDIYQPGDPNSWGDEDYLGTPDQFCCVCALARALGLDVIVDMIFNHVAPLFELKGNTAFKRNWGDPATSDFHLVREIDFRDSVSIQRTGNVYAVLPDLDGNDPDVRDKFDILLYLLVKCGVTGIRIDAASHMEPEAVNFYVQQFSTHYSKENGEGKPLIIVEASTHHQEYIKALSEPKKTLFTDFSIEAYFQDIGNRFGASTSILDTPSIYIGRDSLKDQPRVIMNTPHDWARNPDLHDFENWLSPSLRLFVSALQFFTFQGVPIVMSDSGRYLSFHTSSRREIRMSRPDGPPWRIRANIDLFQNKAHVQMIRLFHAIRKEGGQDVRIHIHHALGNTFVFSISTSDTPYVIIAGSAAEKLNISEIELSGVSNGNYINIIDYSKQAVLESGRIIVDDKELERGDVAIYLLEAKFNQLIDTKQLAKDNPSSYPEPLWRYDQNDDYSVPCLDMLEPGETDPRLIFDPACPPKVGHLVELEPLLIVVPTKYFRPTHLLHTKHRFRTQLSTEWSDWIDTAGWYDQEELWWGFRLSIPYDIAEAEVCFVLDGIQCSGPFHMVSPDAWRKYVFSEDIALKKAIESPESIPPRLCHPWGSNLMITQKRFDGHIDPFMRAIPTKGTTHAFDVIVVGSGLCGGVLAVDLAKAGLSCLVLEAGPLIIHKNFFNYYNESFPLEKFKVGERISDSAFQQVGPRALDYLGIGGKTVFWSGFSPSVPKWEWSYFPQSIIEQFDRAAKTLHTSHGADEDDSFTKAVLEAIRTHVSWEAAPMAMAFENGTNFTRSIVSRGMFSTSDLLLEYASSPYLYVNENSPVTQVMLNSDGSAMGVKCYDMITHQIQEYSAHNVVLSAGVLESARICLASGIQGSKVGKGGTDHPNIRFFGLLDSKTGMGSMLDQDKQYLFDCMDLKRKIRVQIYINVYVLVHYISERLKKTDDNKIRCEIKVWLGSKLDENNSLTLVSPEVRNEDLEIPSMNIVAHRNRPTMARIRECRESAYELASYLGIDMTEIMYVYDETNTAHMGGTLRMGNNPETSVVNEETLQFHRYANLYACDNSVVPYIANANPGRLLVAIAHRMSDHLINKMNRNK